jgi:hypothetical protein
MPDVSSSCADPTVPAASTTSPVQPTKDTVLPVL